MPDLHHGAGIAQSVQEWVFRAALRVIHPGVKAAGAEKRSPSSAKANNGGGKAPLAHTSQWRAQVGISHPGKCMIGPKTRTTSSFHFRLKSFSLITPSLDATLSELLTTQVNEI
jgi:hypothetical protein